MDSPTLSPLPQAANLPLRGASVMPLNATTTAMPLNATGIAMSGAAPLPLPRPIFEFRLSLGILLAIVFWAVAGSLLLTLWLASQTLA